MLSHNIQRCPHFQLHSEQLSLDGPAAYLAIRHCTLTARMLHLLEPSTDALPLAKRLVIQIDESPVYAFVGPDLEVVTQQTCTVKRCDQTCTPCYKQTLSQFGTVDPYEDSVTCNEEDDESADSVKLAASDKQSSACC